MKRIVLLVMLVVTGCSDDGRSQGGELSPETTTPTTSSTSSTASTVTTAPTTASTTTVGGTTAERIAVPDVVGRDLQLAQDTMQAAGLYYLMSHDSTGQGRSQVLDRNWQVTDQSPAAGTMVASDQMIDLGAKKFTD